MHTKYAMHAQLTALHNIKLNISMYFSPLHVGGVVVLENTHVFLTLPFHNPNFKISTVQG